MSHTVTQGRAFSASQASAKALRQKPAESRRLGEFSKSIPKVGTFSTRQLLLDSMARKVGKLVECLQHTSNRLKTRGVYRLYTQLLKRAFLSRDSCPLTHDKANLSTAGGNVLQPLTDF